MIERDRDTDSNGSLEERLYVQQDAKWNVTAIIKTSGNVQERYVDDPYGQVTVYNTTWSGTSTADPPPNWVYLHQGPRYDATTGLYDSRNRDYSPTLGRWTAA